MEYKCPSCAYLSDSITLLHVHCINAHPKEFFTCPWCTVPFATLRILQKHAPNCSALDKNEPREGEINTVLVNNDKCLVCEGRFNSAEMAIKHYKEIHLNFSYICDVCEMYFQHNSSLDMHYATSHAKASISVEVSVPPSISVVTEAESNNKENASAISTDNRNTATNDSTTKIGKRRTIATSFAPSPKKGKFVNTSSYFKRQAMQFFTGLHCLHCKCDFANLTEIQEHYKTEHHTEVFFCPNCDKAYMSKERARKHCREMPCQSKSKYPKHSRNNRKSMPSLKTADIGSSLQQVLTEKQTVLSCPFCLHVANSRELIQSHIANKHSGITLTNVKVEYVDGADASLLTEQPIEMKKELISNFEPFFSNVRSEPPTFGGYFDLTLDD